MPIMVNVGNSYKEVTAILDKNGNTIDTVYAQNGSPVYSAWKSMTLTGVPPLPFKAKGTPLTAWSMSGNSSHTGTPSPQSIIMPTFCGVRTANLYDANGKNTANGYVENYQLNSDGSTSIWGSAEISEYIPIVGGATYSFNGIGSYNSPAYCFYDADKQYISGYNYRGRQKITFTAPSNAKYFRFTHIKAIKNAMCNAGDTVLTYEPFGWAEKITCAGQTVPVYLGQTQTVRRVKKLVLTGQEQWQFFSDVLGAWQLYINNISLGGVAQSSCMSNIAPYGATATTRQIYDYGCYLVTGGNGVGFQMKGAKDTFTDITSWKSYLAQQYAAGHPVTIWYVLATPETGIVNEPLAKIGGYADELHSEDTTVTIPTVKGENTLTVDTPIQPSNVSITGLIRPAQT